MNIGSCLVLFIYKKIVSLLRMSRMGESLEKRRPPTLTPTPRKSNDVLLPGV